MFLRIPEVGKFNGPNASDCERFFSPKIVVLTTGAGSKLTDSEKNLMFAIFK